MASSTIRHHYRSSSSSLAAMLTQTKMTQYYRAITITLAILMVVMLMKCVTCNDQVLTASSNLPQAQAQIQVQHPNHKSAAASSSPSGAAPSSPSSSSSSSSLLYHKNGDDAIDVSSSIGVSMSGGHQSQNVASVNSVANEDLPVDDLLANESSLDGTISNAGNGGSAGGIGQSGLSQASVVDSEQDLIGAETESKFSLSKLKRPFSRLPFDLRLNNRFLNGAASFLTSGSSLTPQLHHTPPLPPLPQAQMQKNHPPHVYGRGPQGPPPPHHLRQGGLLQLSPNFRGGVPNFQLHSNSNNGGGPGPLFKALNQPQQQQQQPGRPVIHHQQQPPPIPPSSYHHHGGPQFGMHQSLPQQQPSQQGGAVYHMIEEPGVQLPTISVGNGGSGSGDGGGANSGGDQSDIIHSISDFIQEDNSLNDYEQRQHLSAPASNDIWPLGQPELAKIVQLDVKCEKNFMKVSVEFDRPYNGMIFSKGHFSSPHCIHLAAGSGRTHIYFDIRMDSCGTTGNMANGNNALMASSNGGATAGNFFENTVIFQYDPFVQEAWDQARKLRCTWHDQYEKSVSFRPFPVDMVDVVRADFAGDNVGCWMQIQVGRGPWASEVAGIVKIGQTMTMVLAIKDEENKFDMLVRNCVAHDGKRAPIELVDTNGCIVRSKLMSRFTKIKNFGSSASVLSYAHFQAFKFPDSMEVHFQCTIQICKHSCPEQCDHSGASHGVQYVNHQISGTINGGDGGSGSSLYISQDGGNTGGYISGGGGDKSSSPQMSQLQNGGASNLGNGVLARPREIRDVSRTEKELNQQSSSESTTISTASTNDATSTNASISKEVGLNKVIRVVSSGDLSFATTDKLTAVSPVVNNDNQDNGSEQSSSASSSSSITTTDITSTSSLMETFTKSWLFNNERLMNEKICMSSLNFIICFAILVALLLISSTCSIVLCCQKRVLDCHQSTLGIGSSCSKAMKSAKEVALCSNMVATKMGIINGGNGSNNASSSMLHNSRNGTKSSSSSTSSTSSTTSGANLSHMSHTVGPYGPLSSSSVLSPRMQAANTNGYHREVYHT